MPDFMTGGITSRPNATLNMPRYTYDLTVVHSTTGEVLRDLTGANGLRWPEDLAGLSDERKLALVEMHMEQLVQWRVEDLQNG